MEILIRTACRYITVENEKDFKMKTIEEFFAMAHRTQIALPSDWWIEMFRLYGYTECTATDKYNEFYSRISK